MKSKLIEWGYHYYLFSDIRKGDVAVLDNLEFSIELNSLGNVRLNRKGREFIATRARVIEIRGNYRPERIYRCWRITTASANRLWKLCRDES